jgi:hypothetical protein
MLEGDRAEIKVRHTEAEDVIAVDEKTEGVGCLQTNGADLG